jgi:PPK2 family polyphosphate:nucleotide phosphotransferase
MKINIKDFRVRHKEKIKLEEWPTTVTPFYKSKRDYNIHLEKHVKALSKLQQLHYAYDRNPLLLIFQGIDSSGKDGAIKHVMSGVNPQGCDVYSFKQPSSEELQHDFLWRTTRCLPERGRIAIFNRSYYEEVIVTRVHPELLRNEGITGHDDKTFWEERYHAIVNFEEYLYRNNTRVIKFFLHLSKDEQRKRFLERLDTPDKHWKFSLSDIHERKYWADYKKAFEKCVKETSTPHTPWYIIPADDKENARLIVSEVIIDTLSALKMTYPKGSRKRQQELELMRRELENEE